MKPSQRRHARANPRSSKRYRGACRRRRLFLETLEKRWLLDGVGPSILAFTPNEVRNDVFDHIDVTFNEAIDLATFTVDDVSINGPSGNVSASNIGLVSGNTYRIDFAPLTVRDNYEAILGPDVADLNGNLMDQNQDGTNGAADDTYLAAFVYIDASTIFNGNLTIAEGDTTYDGEDILIDGATVAIDGSHAFNSVHLVNGAILTHSANTTTATYKLDFAVNEQVIVDASSRIDVSGKGYPQWMAAPGAAVPTRASGGSHGGSGGDGYVNSNPGSAGSVYGNYADPNELGGGAGFTHSTTTGSGGGLVRIEAASLYLDGQILSDGQRSQGPSGGGGGAGGTIYVEVGFLTGSGSMHARGGNGVGFVYYGSNTGGGGGGGGRVAVYASDSSGFDLQGVTATGGFGSKGGSFIGAPGGAGTVYLRDTDEAVGTLIIDGSGGGAGWTPH
ncbi:MAG: Ig-like domain-containing protein [Pirellulaceae bacterium]